MIGARLRQLDLPWRQLGLAVGAVAVIAASAWLGYNTPRMNFGRLGRAEVIIEAIALAFLLFAILRRIEWGVILLVVAAFFVRISLSTGSATRLPASLLLAILVFGIWILTMLAKKQFKLFPNRANTPLLIFMVLASLSLPWSWLFWRADLFAWREAQSSGTAFEIVQLGGLVVMLMLPIVFLLAANTLTEVKWFRYLNILVIGIALPELFQRLLNIYPNFGGIEISGPGLYHVWLIGLAYGQLLFNDKLKDWQKALFVIIIAGWCFWAFVLKIEWVSGWGPVLVTIVFLTWIKSRRAVLLLLALGALVIMMRPTYFYDKIIVESERGQDFTRFWLWRTIVFDLTLTKADALLGTGPAGYAPYFQTYYPNRAMSAHNNYVDIIAQTGILGFGFFLMFLFAVFRTGWEQRNSFNDSFLTAFNNGVLGGFLGMLSAMMLNDWFMPFVYNTGIPAFDWNVYAWILIGAMVSLGRFARLESAAATVPKGTPAPKPQLEPARTT